MGKIFKMISKIFIGYLIARFVAKGKIEKWVKSQFRLSDGKNVFNYI